MYLHFIIVRTCEEVEVSYDSGPFGHGKGTYIKTNRTYSNRVVYKQVHNFEDNFLYFIDDRYLIEGRDGHDWVVRKISKV